MRRMTKILSFALALLLFLPLFAACSQKTENADEPKSAPTETAVDPSPVPGGDEAETEEETARWLDNVPQTMDYGGRTLRFALYEGAAI